MVLALDTVEISDWRFPGQELSLTLCLHSASHSGALTLVRFSRRYFNKNINYWCQWHKETIQES